MSSKAARRYARALFSLAAETDQLEQVRGDLSGLSDAILASEDLAAFFAHPLVPMDQRQGALRALFDGRISELAVRFLLLLEEKNRLGLFPGIQKEFQALYREHMNILDVRVTSAVALDADQEKKLTAKLQERFGKTVHLRKEVRTELVGGLRIQAGDQVLDSSAATLLESFKRALAGA